MLLLWSVISKKDLKKYVKIGLKSTHLVVGEI